MKKLSRQFQHPHTQLLTVLALSMAMLMPVTVFAREKDAHEDRAELRIKDMHSKLNITTAQEPQWSKLEAEMREDAKQMDSLTQARVDHAKTMTAVDDLKSYAEIADAHAAGIKKFTPLFAELYTSMSDEQKKQADALFQHGYQHHGDHKHGHHKTAEQS